MSDTPISDSTPHNVADLGMLCRRLERELNASNEMFRKLNLHTLNLTDRIKRLEEELNDNGLVLQKIQHERDGSNERIKRLEREVELLRLYGNKDCIAQADEVLKQEAKL